MLCDLPLSHWAFHWKCPLSQLTRSPSRHSVSSSNSSDGVRSRWPSAPNPLLSLNNTAAMRPPTVPWLRIYSCKSMTVTLHIHQPSGPYCAGSPAVNTSSLHGWVKWAVWGDPTMLWDIMLGLMLKERPASRRSPVWWTQQANEIWRGVLDQHNGHWRAPDRSTRTKASVIWQERENPWKWGREEQPIWGCLLHSH